MLLTKYGKHPSGPPPPLHPFPQIWESWLKSEIIGDSSVQTMPLKDGWGYRFFQTASHIHMFSIYCVWAPSIVVDGHMDPQLRCYHHICFPRLWELAEILSDVSVKTMPLKNGWGYRLSKVYSISAHLPVVDGRIATTKDVVTDLGELAEIVCDVNVQTMQIHCGTFHTASHVHVIHT